MAKDKIRVGMVGLGVISWAHEGGFTEAAEQCAITAMCDIDAARASDRASIHSARAYTDYHELIHDPDVDLVDIILPHHLHHQAALETIEAHKHLLIEKPLAMTYADSLEICQRAEARGIHFSVAENTRYVKAYIEAER
ncbi:MAG: Gfo/Idh/MocA family protein, partial [Acidobacteriaceae bacterium]